MVQQEVDEGSRLRLLPVALLAAGRDAEADEALKTLIARWADLGAYGIALNYAYRGDRDLALQWLERAYLQKSSGLLTMGGDPLFKNMAGDPRYEAFVRKMNLPE